ncbi:glycine-rich RNA-binding protein 2-like isoform X2 [Folsomia candida]|uniref:glycine-rich RNA-binding protein 2-like isoform X2 n=1 Tax=Folsomia candida TaxID=158441 RepID=UPI0016050F60|nr:glycine-rich RNA-binding protein 2-like isoform X2 [Folsomia candida]
MIYNTSLSIITLCILTIIQASLSLHDEVVSKENETTIVTNGTSQITQGKALEKHIVFPSEENSITPKTANSSSVNATNQTEKLPDGHNRDKRHGGGADAIVIVIKKKGGGGGKGFGGGYGGYGGGGKGGGFGSYGGA